jgi:hypothetical protein
MACYQRQTLVLIIYHTSELATSLATSTRLHILLGLQSDRLYSVAAVAAPASVPQQAEEKRERAASPSAGPPVLASVPLGGASGLYTGDEPLCTPRAPHTWQHVSERHVRHLRTSFVVFFHCTSQKVHTADASRPLGGQAPHLPGNRSDQTTPG